MSNKTIKYSLKSKQEGCFLLCHWLQIFINVIICFYMVFIIVVIPYYTKFDYGVIGTDKVNLFLDTNAVLAKLMLPIWVAYLSARLYLNFKKHHKSLTLLIKGLFHSLSVTDIFVLVYLAAVLLSYLFSDYQAVALEGANAWGMGLLTQIVLPCSYFFISRLWKTHTFFPFLFIPATAFLFILSYLNRFGVYPFKMNNLNPQFLSFVGNINWFCGYMVMPIFGCACFVLCSELTNRYLRYALKGYLFISFAALITNGSSSGVLTLLGIFFLMFLMSVRNVDRFLAYCNLLVIFSSSCMFTLIVRILFPDTITYNEGVTEVLTYSFIPCILFLVAICFYFMTKKWKRFNTYPKPLFSILAKAAVAFVAVVLVVLVGLIVLNTLMPGCIGSLSEFPVFTFSAEWGSRRGATWIAGWMAWLEQSPLKKLIGVGPDCMKEYIYTDGSDKLLSFCYSVWPNHTLANAHNELLTLLVNYGILGAVSFVGILGSSIVRYLRQWGKNNSLESKIVAACGMCIAAYTIHNMVSFQQILNEPTMFLLLGMGEAYIKRKKQDTKS